ncbi:MAG TPA: P27 family phage terminase small subunit [Acetobacteraceae bacterium]|nr:P27 family phage terminase small subunit [Acetobacteraceae bacterium]
MTDSQKASWLYAVGNAPAGVLKAIDAGVLAVWVVAEDQHRRATEAQACLDAGKTLPLVTKGRRGVIVASPYLKIIAQAGDRMRAAAAQLGFSPAARPRTPPPAQPPRASPWGRFEVLPGEKK